MTDKQIIIDEIDVSKCRHYDDRYGYCEACKDDIDGVSFTKCLYEDNCYYKQFKRSEAQCEAMFVSHTDLEKKYKAKEQECEELTSKCSQLEEEIKDWQKEVERIQFIGSYGIMDEVKKNTKLEQTLTEIKTDILDIREGISYFWVIDKCDKILQKISEVEDDNI